LLRRTPVSLYRVHFKWKEKEVELMARKLDLTHPYFVSIKDIIFEDKSGLLINPAQDDVKKTFGEADHLMIPFQTVSLIEELPEKKEQKKETNKVMPFSLVNDEKKGEEDDP
jgi:hypothetical protein